MDPILCRNCGNYIIPKSGKCPKCGNLITLADIVPDSEVDRFKESTTSKLKTILIIELVIVFLLMSAGWAWLVIVFIIPLIITICQYYSISKYDFEEWRVEASKQWKYKTTLQKAGIILKLVSKV